ncbi:thiol reductant ABC exporter subunit CydD [Aidingimonas halophila]|uniref:ATP-binding cassette, subfamily C, CydD n=1 Tax=Aidingimonas halophila TaxID=574349 RepID=A0A1H3GFW8_9GAMM|nr:thiol reductant ABC exporter subunit CydD [Aidingimonas halophila]GHC33197.1 cysteine/glutathione ABC transporter membrane protein/ATP-binding protein [Aidingimonas halophila]SDY02242.1 ATP-binding cassette, subfamily C, CydD [Aidingimonas halophila]
MSDTDTGAAAMSPRHWLGRLAKQQRHWLIGSVLLGGVASALTVLQMVGLAWLISQLVVAGTSPDSLLPVFAGLAGAVLLRSLLLWSQEAAGQEASLNIRQRARDEVLNHLERLGPVRLSGYHSAGLGNQLVDQVEALDGYIARFLPQQWLAIWQPLLILAVVVWLDWLAALFLLLSAPMIPLFMALVGMGAERLNRDQFAAVARLAGHFIDRVRGITTLQLFARGVQATDEVYDAADHYRRLSMKTLRLAFLSSAVLEFFAAVAIAVVAIYVGFGLLGYIDYGPSPSLTLFSGLTILLLAPEFFQPLRTLSQHYHDRAAALGAAEGLVRLLAMETADGQRVSSSSSPAAAEDVGGSASAIIQLTEVTVFHGGRDRVLGPLSVTFYRGETVALAGPSGAGKSTLLQLLAGFIEPHSGHLQMPPLEGVAWMDQRPWLIQGTLADNLNVVSPDASEEAMIDALTSAGLGRFLATLPSGLDTPLGERGVGLSGGQAQRLALARVFLSKARLVLLDEPTASLDHDTEAGVIESIRILAQGGRTVVIATHHPALMAMADRTLILDQGRIDEVRS